MELETPYVHLCIRKGILVGTYKTNQQINLAAAKEIVSARKAFTGRRTLPALIVSQGLVSIDPDARRYLSSEEATAGLKASAIVVKSVFSSFLGNFFLQVHKTAMPVKIFTDFEKAEQWLSRFL